MLGTSVINSRGRVRAAGIAILAIAIAIVPHRPQAK